MFRSLLLFFLLAVGLLNPVVAPSCFSEPAILDTLKYDKLKITTIPSLKVNRFKVGHDLKKGSKVYVDRNFTYWNVPKHLEDSDYFITYNEDKFQKGGKFIQFEHPYHLYVYVAFDNRLAIPSWAIHRGFTNTGMSIDVHVPDNKTYLKFNLYRKKFAPGKIVLGGNLNDNDDRNGAMYLVIFQNLGFFKFNGNSAEGDDHHGDFDELQGISNGDPEIDPYWFFSRNGIAVYDLYFDTIIYRVGYQHHLKNDFPCYVHHVQLMDDIKCKHIGDIKYLRRPQTNEGYIFAAYDNCKNKKSYIAVFRSSDIKDISGNRLKVHGMLDVTSVQGREAYVTSARHVLGRKDLVNLYSGAGKLQGTKDKIYEYQVRWLDIAKGGHISMQSSRSHSLVYPDGNPFIVEDWQGIDFSEDGQFLYMSVGADHYLGNTDRDKKRIHVLKKHNQTQWKLYHSSTHKHDGNPFLYQAGRELEPEGISWFDMNKVSNYHPNMPRGELHALVLDNDGGSSDDIYIKHYTSNP